MSVYDGIEALNLKSDLQTFDSSTSPLFKEFVDEIKPRVIFDVGAWKGVSALIWAELGKPYGAHVHSIDTFLGSLEHFIKEPALVPRDPWGAPILYHQFLVNVKNAGYADAITPHVMTSRDGAKWLKHLGITAQIISIDADHSPEGSYEDISNYWGLLEPGGMMVGDDALIYPGVFAAALRFSVEQNIPLITKDPFWIMRKPGALWPTDYNLSRHHCADVLAGCYEVSLPMENPRILDIGANVGAFARWAKARWPHSKIHCYEPHPVNFFLLKRTVKDFRLGDVEICEAAVSDKDGQADFHHNGPNCGEWSLASNAATHDKMTVRTIAAKDLPDADFIKLDTEGAEPEILLLLAQAGKLAGVSSIALEYHSANAIEPLKALMAHQGFKLVFFQSFSEHRGLLKFTR